MKEMLKSLGEDLAEKVKRENLPTVEVDIPKPKSKENRALFPRVLWTMRRRVPLLFVSQQIDYASAYLNSLAVIFDNEEEWISKISPYSDFLFSESKGSDGTEFPYPLHGKRFFAVDMKAVLEVAQESWDSWTEILSFLNSREFTQKYFLVLNNLPYLFDTRQTKALTKHFSSFNLFIADTGFRFLAPMDWQDFSLIEQTNPYIIKRVYTVLFSPRPSNLLSIHHSKLVDERWKF